MTTKTTKKAKSVDVPCTAPASVYDDNQYVRQVAMSWAIDMFKHPSFVKEANAYSIVSLADTFSTFVTKGKDAAFPGVNTPAAS